MPNTLAKSWLTLQCQMIPGVTRACVSLEPASASRFVPAACWPDGLSEYEELAEAARLAGEKRTPVLRAGKANGSGAETRPVIVAIPMSADQRPGGVVVVEVEAREGQQQAVIELLKWGAVWLQFLLQQEPSKVAARRLETVVEITATSLEHRRFQEAASAVVTRLAGSLGCERVSLGVLEDGHARVQALSHTSHLEQRTNLVRDIEEAMEEALGERAALTHPPPSSGPPRATRAHERLARRQHVEAVCSVPLVAEGRLVGVLTCERSHGPPFDADTVALCEAIGTLVGPVLESKRREEQSMLTRARDALSHQFARLLGPGHVGLKAGALAAVVTTAFLALATGEYRISAPAQLEGSVHQALVAPIDSYIEAAHARAGDLVAKGDVVATLDDQDLRLELRRLSSELDELIRQERRAVAGLERAQAGILAAQIGKTRTQIALIEEQIARARIVTPIDGVIVSGDLSRSLGAPVERGQVLFEVAPLDAYRLALQVDEADVADVAPGQQGQLVLAALPGERFPFVIEQVIGIAEVEDGRNAFRVEGRLERAPELLRPGMKGVAKFPAGERRLLWIWTHTLRDKMRLWLWQHLP